ncbi:Zinc finger BED domain-containing protein 4 [Frankliniella fusca]|uniref:Zinc finger BED domain-containing protein 4 n=1 Tax=Frankliniella fusca TaxID=407009 RepID=A0AAE1LSV7_9NEOP|nr:Zinc finger BED domain-containing protein 4 [Frankliniella fusca]
MVKNVATRWNSEYLMLSRFLEQRAAITLELSDSGEEGLTPQQWKMVEGYVQILKPIAEYTAYLGSTKQPTLSMVNPVLFEIKNTLEDFLRKPTNKGCGIQFGRALLNNVKLRFPDNKYKTNKLYVIATLLDPRFKALLMNDEEAKDILLRAALQKSIEKSGDASSLVASTNEPTNGESAPKKSKWCNLGQLSKSKSEQPQDNSDLISKEVQIFLSLPTIDVETGDAVSWWKSNKQSFPHLLPLAAEYLGICATEVPSERVFSDGGNTVCPKRTRLLTEHVREIVFLHGNLELPKLMKHKNITIIDLESILLSNGCVDEKYYGKLYKSNELNIHPNAAGFVKIAEFILDSIVLD